MNELDFSSMLLTLQSHGGTVEGRKRFQKIVCILASRDGIPFTFEFIPYHYGPFSENLSSALDTLVGLGLIEEERRMITDDIIQYVYSLTSEGRRLTHELAERLRRENPELVQRIENSVHQFAQMNTPELVRLSKEVFNYERELVQ